MIIAILMFAFGLMSGMLMGIYCVVHMDTSHGIKAVMENTGGGTGADGGV